MNHESHQNASKLNLLIGVSGSVAAIKAPHLVQILSPLFNIKVIFTFHARKFISEEDIQIWTDKQSVQIYFDENQWEVWKKRGDPVLHIELRKWADLMLIAPLSANTLAKISQGLSDNLLTLVCRAWKMEKQENKLTSPIFICPAMNTYMWDHPITKKQLDILAEWGFAQIGPIQKKLMCNQVGNGAMAEIQQIQSTLKNWATKKMMKQ